MNMPVAGHQAASCAVALTSIEPVVPDGQRRNVADQELALTGVRISRPKPRRTAFLPGCPSGFQAPPGASAVLAAQGPERLPSDAIAAKTGIRKSFPRRYLTQTAAEVPIAQR
ncbi:MAG: hypothetical protein HOV87_17125 [Catenulispora sp.]|nr:hypothetical protein [Catenulispora sp.]